MDLQSPRCWVMLLGLVLGCCFADGNVARAQAPAVPAATGPHFFVPLEQLQTLIQQDKKWVLLNQDEFQKLQEAAKLNAGKPLPPDAIGVGNVKYVAKVEEDQLVLQATMQITKFSPGWQTLPLEFTDLSVEKATLDDQPARLGRDAQAGGRLTLVLDQPGKKTLTLQLSRPLLAVGSDKLATFGLPRLSGIELTLDLDAQKHLQWNGLPVERPAANDQPAQYKLALGGQKQVELKITDRPTQQSSEGLVFAHTAIGVRASPVEVTWQAIASLQVFGKPIDTLQFRVPEALQIVSITSAGLESWEFGPKGPENGETILNLRYRQPFQEPRDVTIQAVMAAKSGEGWLVPSLKLANVASHTADVVVTAAPGMRLQVEEAVGVQRAAAGEPNAAAVPGGMRFTAWREDFLLRFTTQPKAREISAAIVTLLDINSSGLNLKSNVTVETRFAPLFEVLLTLPAEWTVTDVLVNQARVAWETVPQEAGIHQLRIPFASPLAADQQAIIQLQAHRDPEGWPLEEGKVAISLPEVRLIQSNVVEGTVMVAAEQDLDVEPEQLKGLSPAILDKAVAARLAYEYQDTHYSGQIQVTRKPSRIAARTLAFHRLDKETLFSHLEARLDIQGGGTRKLVLSLPESAGTNLRFEVSESVARIVEQTAAAPANGRRAWTLLLDQRARGGLLALVDVSQPRQKATEFLPPTLQVVGAERETGMIAFEAEPDQQLDLVVQDAAGVTLPDVDPADLPPPTAYAPKDRIVAAYGYVLPGYQLKLTERRFERLAVPTAICDKLEIVSILGETGEFQHAATFRLRAVGVQSLQIVLPEGAQLWATQLDGTPIEVRHTDSAYLIPLASLPGASTPANEDAKRERMLKLFYRTNAGVLAADGRLKETPPDITVLNGDGSEQPLEILQQEWIVHHPWETEFVASPGSFQAEQAPRPIGFLSRVLSHFKVDSPEKLLWKLAAIIGAIALIWIVRLIVARTGFMGLAGAGCLIALMFILYNLPGEFEKHSSKKTETKKTAVRHVETKTSEEAMPTSADGTRNEATPEYAGKVREFNQLMEQRRFKEAEAVAERLHAIDPTDPTAEIARWKAKFGFRVDENNKLRDSKEEGFWAALDSLEHSAIPFDDRDPVQYGKEWSKLNKSQREKLRDSDRFRKVQIDGPQKAEEPQEAKTESKSDEMEEDQAKDQKAANEQPQVAQTQTEQKKAEEMPVPAAPQAANPAPGKPGAGPPAVQLDGVPQMPPRQPELARPQPPAGNANLNFDPAAPVAATKAVLSLALQLEPPADSQTTTYAYRGRGGSEPVELIVDYQNRARLSFVTLLLQFLVVLVCWTIRNRPATFRLALLSFGIVVPLAALTVVPQNWLPFLDGLFRGTLWGCGLLAMHAACRWLQTRVHSWAEFWKLMEAPISRSNVFIWAIVLTCGNGLLLAQEPAAQPQANPAASVPGAQAAQPPRPAAISISPPANTLLVPLPVDLDPEKSDRVFLSHDKFLELWKQGHPNEVQNTESAFPGLIAETLFAAELVPAKGDAKPFVKMTGRFVCYSFRDGQISLPLPLGKVAVSSAKLDGAAAPLVQGNDANPLAILLSQPGVHIVDLEFSIPVELTGPAGKLTLPLGAVTVGSLRFTAPAADLNYRVNGSSGAFRKIKVGEQQIVLVPIANGGDIQISWRPQQSRGDVEAIVHVDSVTALLLNDAGTRLLSDWNFQVRQGALSEILFALPATLGVRKIEGPDVGGWEVAGAGDNRELKIFLRRKVEDATPLKFDLFVKQKPDDLETLYEIPQFAPKNITRETGTLAVLAGKQFGIRATQTAGLSQIEPQQVALQRLGEAQPEANVLSYRFATRPYQLEIAVTRRQPQLKVQGRHHSHIDPRKIHVLSRFKFNLLGAPRSSLAILIPQGYLLQDVQAADASDWHVSGREDSAQMDAEAQLFLEFPTPRTGNIDVVLIGKSVRQPEVLKAEINLPYPLEVDELDTQLLTTIDAIYAARIGTLDNWKSIDPGGLTQAFLGRETTSGQFGFSTNTPAPAPIEVELTQQVPKLSANVLTLLTVEEESLDYLFAMQWKIDTAGADTFVFTTPDSLAGKLEFPEGNGPRRRGIVQESVGNGRTRWTVTLEDPQRDQFFLIARTVLPPAANAQVVAPNILFEQRQPGQDPPLIEPLEIQAQYVVLVNQSQTQLTSAAPDSVETIPADDMLQIIKLRQDLVQQAAEIVRVKTPQVAVSWKQQRFQAEQLLPASVNLAHHITVLAADGSWREQVTYRLRNRSRQFIALKLPVDSQVLSLFVKGQAARPVQSAKDAAVTLIPLPKTTEGDVSFEVQLVLAGHLASGRLPQKWALLRRKLEIPVPVVVPPEDSAEYGIPVAQSTWTVYAPRDLDVEIVKQAETTNVNPVSETLQEYDQTSALFSDISELISVNSSTYNRRAKAQSLNNLKQLNEVLSKSVTKKSVSSNSQESAKQQDLERRVSQLQDSINKLVITNSESGLSISNDSSGNAIVIDQKAGQQGQGQAGRITELYDDNGGQATPNSDPNALDFSEVTATPGLKSHAEPANGDAQMNKKGNLNRDELRGRNQSQVRALSEAQQKESGNQQQTFAGEQQNGSQNGSMNNRSYFFRNDVALGQDSRQQAGWMESPQARAINKNLGLENEGVIGGMGGGMGGGGFGNRVARNGQQKGLAANVGGPQGAQQGLPADQAANPAFGDQLPQIWTSSGGLSLLIEIPTDGQKLSFSKVGGEPRLMLGVRPHQTLQMALGFLWTAIWAIILLVVLATLRRPQATVVLARRLPWFIAGLGLLLYCMVPSQAVWGLWGLFAFVIGSVWIAFLPVIRETLRSEW